MSNEKKTQEAKSLVEKVTSLIINIDVLEDKIKLLDNQLEFNKEINTDLKDRLAKRWSQLNIASSFMALVFAVFLVCIPYMLFLVYNKVEAISILEEKIKNSDDLVAFTVNIMSDRFQHSSDLEKERFLKVNVEIRKTIQKVEARRMQVNQENNPTEWEIINKLLRSLLLIDAAATLDLEELKDIGYKLIEYFPEYDRGYETLAYSHWYNKESSHDTVVYYLKRAHNMSKIREVPLNDQSSSLAEIYFINDDNNKRYP